MNEMEQIYAIGALLLIQMIMIFAIAIKLGRLHRYIGKIVAKVESYLAAVLKETESEGFLKESASNMSGQEEQMREAIEKKRRKQQEAVFDAVLQEIFP